jgi:transcriptional regulator with XRE-family HTH domain
MPDDRFGRRMRLERERRGVALETVAARTKISVRLLSDLERDQLSHWPRGIFRRAFVRSYAEAIGVDPDTALLEFVEDHPDPPEPLAPIGGASPQVAAASAVARLTAAPPVALRDRAPLRLTFADTPRAFSGGPVLISVGRRLAAAAWDAGSMFAVAALVRIGLVQMGIDQFWAPFGAVVLCYQVCSILSLGNTPGIYLFAPSAGLQRHSGTANPAAAGEASELSGSSIFEPRATART